MVIKNIVKAILGGCMNKIKNNRKGFTLLELLVVVLIIAVLAAIALPQYQMAVGRAKFATLKEFTRSVAEARNRYFLTHSEYPKSAKDLDIDIEVNNDQYFSESKIFKFDTVQDINCAVWSLDSFHSAAACSKNILGKKISFYVNKNGYTPQKCLVYSIDQNDKANRLCQKETNKHADPNCCKETYCSYSYP